MTGYFHTGLAHDAYYNMAYDEWLLKRVEDEPHEIHLRLYTWSPGAITIGLNQDLERAVRTDRLGNTPVIRRVTGGRALYHDPSELTYSLACNLDGAEGVLPHNKGDLYRLISSALVSFLIKAGVEADYVKQSSRGFAVRERHHRSPCFESTARYEVVGRGGKIIASAACWRGKSLLQHGSIKLLGVVPHPALPDLSSGNTPQPAPAITRQEFERSGELVVQSFSETLGISFDEFTLGEDHTAQISQAAKSLKKNPTSARLYF